MMKTRTHRQDRGAEAGCRPSHHLELKYRKLEKENYKKRTAAVRATTTKKKFKKGGKEF